MRAMPKNETTRKNTACFFALDESNNRLANPAGTINQKHERGGKEDDEKSK